MSLELKVALRTVVLLVLLVEANWLASVIRGERLAARSALAEAALIVPVAGVRADQLVDSWGAPRSGGRLHEGIDIGAPLGTPVRAAASGTIVKLHSSRLGGTTLYQLDASGRLIFLYAHLKAYATRLKAGEAVMKGQVLGYVGTTGNAKTPHLHFEIHQANREKQWWRGASLNPYSALTSRWVEALPAPVLSADRRGLGTSRR